jgi:predicted O-methyltransferase YrrM
MNFTEDWFTHNIPNFEKCMAAIPEKKLFLEIGVFEGRSTCWLLENGLADTGSIVCVDPFSGMQAVEARFWNNVRATQKSTQTVSAFKKPSYEALAEMIGHKYTFDFVYVDGVHSAIGALTDACMAWGLLKQGGVMLFDDYLYPHEPTKVGIDAFLNSFDGYEILVDNYQLAVKKK